MSFIVKSAWSDKMLAVLAAAEKSQTPVVLVGDPGVGKTEFVKAISEEQGRDLVTILAATLDPTDVAGYPVRTEYQLKDGSTVWTTSNAAPDWVIRLMEADKSTCFADELSSAPPATSAAFLTFFQNRKVPNGPTVPDTVWMIAAMNPSEIAANGFDLPAPLANRFLHLDFDPPVEDWVRGTTLAWGKEVSKAESKWRVTIATFIRRYPRLLHAMPNMRSEESASGAWPSRRSWDNLAKALGSIGEDVDNDVIYTLAQGLVGRAATSQFVTYLHELDLPDPEVVMDNPNVINWASGDDGYLFATLASVVSFGTMINPEKVANVIVTYADRGRQDISISLVIDYLQMLSHYGRTTGKMPKFPKALVDAHKDLLVELGIH